MGWSAGTYSRVGGSTAWGDDRDAAVEIEAGLHDTHDEDLASGINNCLAKDGQNSATSDINLGNNKLINVTDPTSAQDAATKNYVDTASPFIGYFASGDQWLARLAATPSGWSVASVNNKAIRTTTGTPSNGGSVAFTTVFGSARATTSESSHTHSFSDTSSAATNVNVQTGVNASVAQASHTHSVSGTTGAGSSHSHTSNLAVQYHDFRVYQKS